MGRLDLEQEQEYGRHMEHVRPETEDVHLLVAFVVGGSVLLGARRQQKLGEGGWMGRNVQWERRV